MDDSSIDDDVRRALIGAWHRFLTNIDPLRPQFFAFCRRLTGNVWDAEDLVQDALLAAFGHVANTMHHIDNPRAFLLRIATNLWIDRWRHRSLEARTPIESASRTSDAEAERAVELHEAATALLHLPARERAAIVLKDTFDLSLDETAAILGTSVGAVKSALSRGRARLTQPDAAVATKRSAPVAAVVEAFVARYNARDLDGVIALLDATSHVRMYGFHEDVGRDAIARDKGWLYHNFFNPFDGSTSTARWQLAASHGENVVLVFGGFGAPDRLSSVMRVAANPELPGRIGVIHVYALCPDIVTAVATELELSVQASGYHFPLDVSGTA